AAVLSALDARDPEDTGRTTPAPRAKAVEKAGSTVQPAFGQRERRATLVVLGLAVAAAAFLLIRAGREPLPAAAGGGFWRGRLERVTAPQGEALRVCDPDGKACRALAPGAELAGGSRLVTDPKTRAELVLSDGSRISLDRGTEIALLGDGPRHARLVRGALVADIAPSKVEARIELPRGVLTVHGTKFSLQSDELGAAVNVARGSVTLADRESRSVRVASGETGRLEQGAPPFVGFASGLGESLAWSEETFEAPARRETPRGLGELRAKKPGQDAEQKGAVRLASHSVRVRVAGAVARTEVEEVFENTTNDVLEGIYRFPLPPGAQIERLALEVDGKLEEGAFVDRDRAAAIWRGAIQNSLPKQRPPVEEIVWVPGPWRDPALLEWQRGGRFELRIFPIPKQGSRRVILAYTEVVRASGGTRRYTYPLAYDPSGTTRVGRFDLDVEVRGHDERLGVRGAGYSLVAGRSADGASSLRFSESGFVPNGDLSLEYALPDRGSELTAWSYLDTRAAEPEPPTSTTPHGARATASRDGAPYVAISLRPKLPRPERGGPRSFALVVDSSRSMFGESYRRAADLAVRVARELAPEDRVTVLACGVECRVLPGGALGGGQLAGGEVRKFLDGIQPEDGSDLVGAVERALGELGGADRSGDAGGDRRVIYVGDGAPTVGQVRPGSVERAVARSVGRRPASVIAVAVGAESDQATLAALARGGGGVLVPYVPGESVLESAYAVIGASSGSALSDVSLTLPEGMRSIAPARLDAIPAGGEAFVVARMDNLELTGDVVLRGKVSGRAFEQRYPLRLRASEARGNAFVPRLFASARITDLEREGTSAAREEAVALSSRFSVASRYTSLLVLESEAMFRAFGLDNTRSAPDFSGEEAAQAESAEGTLDVGAEDEARADGSGSGTLSGIGLGGGGLGAPSGRSARGPASMAPGDASEAKALSRAEARPAPAPSTPAPAPKPASPAKKSANADVQNPFEFEDPPPRPRRMIPMRKVWQRNGEVVTERLIPRSAGASALEAAARELERDENRRESLKKLFRLSLAAGDLARAETLAARWSEKEPLDPEAITARADVLASRGERSAAIRVLGSVVDVRPGDVAAQKRLARLARWAGRRELGCRYAIAISEMRPGDAG
ncbi:MAG TPA: VIT domain-containing protein, partial [Polyangiaceae bacterium]